MLLTLVNSAVIIWIIWIVGGGREKEENEVVRGAEARKGGERVHKKKVGTDVEVMQVLRKLQASQVKSLLNLDVDSMSNEEAMDRFYYEVSTPVQGVCHSLKRFGGRWRPKEQAFDGDKFVCTDSYSPKDCLVYSFGISTPELNGSLRT